MDDRGRSSAITLVTKVWFVRLSGLCQCLNVDL